MGSFPSSPFLSVGLVFPRPSVLERGLLWDKYERRNNRYPQSAHFLEQLFKAHSQEEEKGENTEFIKSTANLTVPFSEETPAEAAALPHSAW